MSSSKDDNDTSGDVVAIILPNCLEYPVLVQGCLYLGITITPINPAYTAHEISRQLSASQATVIFGHHSIHDKLQQTLQLPASNKINKTILVGSEDKLDGCLNWSDFINSSSGKIPDQAEIDLKNDIAVLPFSSGTTGVPKGVKLSQHNLVVNPYSIICNDSGFMIAASGLQQETTISILPMFHIFGLNVTMTSGIYAGIKQVHAFKIYRLTAFKYFYPMLNTNYKFTGDINDCNSVKYK